MKYDCKSDTEIEFSSNKKEVLRYNNQEFVLDGNSVTLPFTENFYYVKGCTRGCSRKYFIDCCQERVSDSFCVERDEYRFEWGKDCKKKAVLVLANSDWCRTPSECSPFGLSTVDETGGKVSLVFFTANVGAKIIAKRNGQHYRDIMLVEGSSSVLVEQLESGEYLFEYINPPVSGCDIVGPVAINRPTCNISLMDRLYAARQQGIHLFCLKSDNDYDCTECETLTSDAANKYWEWLLPQYTSDYNKCTDFEEFTLESVTARSTGTPPTIGVWSGKPSRMLRKNGKFIGCFWVEHLSPRPAFGWKQYYINFHLTALR